jgi:hypothetical protein
MKVLAPLLAALALAAAPAAAQGTPYDLVCDTLSNASGKVRLRNCVPAAPTPTPAPTPPADTAPPRYRNACDTVACIAVAPGQFTQARFDAHPAGTKFRILPGLHARASATPRRLQQLHFDSGAVLDGRDSVANAIVYKDGVAADGWVFKGPGVVRRYTDATAGAFKLFNAPDAVIDGLTFEHNRRAGWTIGARSVVRNTTNRENGIMGGGCYRAHGSRIENNRFLNNNPGGTVMTPATSATAGLKCLQTDSLVIVGNLCDQTGTTGTVSACYWLDSRNKRWRFTKNVARGGNKCLWVEISFGGVADSNDLRGCGGKGTSWIDAAGVLVSNSPGVTIRDNVVDAFDGIVGTESPRSDVQASEGLTLRDLTVTRNRVRMAAGGFTGLGWSKNATDTTTRSYIYAADRRNVFSENHYEIPSTWTTPFYWANGARTRTYWQGTAKQDVASTFTAIP